MERTQRANPETEASLDHDVHLTVAVSITTIVLMLLMIVSMA